MVVLAVTLSSASFAGGDLLVLVLLELLFCEGGGWLSQRISGIYFFCGIVYYWEFGNLGSGDGIWDCHREHQIVLC